MKVYRNIFYILILIISAGLLISCDLLFPAPLGRDNLLDDEVQIGRFDAVVSGIDSIMTEWDWRSPVSGIDNSRIIDKIRIVYKKNDQPNTMYPIDSDNVKKFSSSSAWSYNWTNLDPDIDHHFALYAHEKGGVWLAPKYTYTWIDDNGSFKTWPWTNTKLYVSTSSPINTVGSTILYITGTTSGSIGFMKFTDLYDNDFGAVVDAGIQGWNVTNGGSIYIVPVRKEINDGMSWSEIDDTVIYDYEHSTIAAIVSLTDIVDISDQINMARLHGSNTLAFIAADAGLNISIDSLTFWDGSNDLFSVWGNN